MYCPETQMDGFALDNRQRYNEVKASVTKRTRNFFIHFIHFGLNIIFEMKCPPRTKECRKYGVMSRWKNCIGDFRLIEHWTLGSMLDCQLNSAALRSCNMNWYFRNLISKTITKSIVNQITIRNQCRKVNSAIVFETELLLFISYPINRQISHNNSLSFAICGRTGEAAIKNNNNNCMAHRLRYQALSVMRTRNAVVCKEN